MNGPTLAISLALLALAAPALAEPTEVVVRVIAQDAKFVGNSTGGARVTLRNARSGKVLAEGLTAGGTGNTELIMDSSGRSPVRADDSAASFAATLDLDAPTLVELDVQGPMGLPDSALRVSQERWIMPGKPVTVGGGWVVELNGLAIVPETARDGTSLAIKAKVEPMCGCPITPGGRWPAEEYSVEASLWLGGKEIASAPLVFASVPGGYAGSLALPAAGENYHLIIFAQNTRTGNSGYVEGEVPAQ